jgi:hypothetical protein
VFGLPSSDSRHPRCSSIFASSTNTFRPQLSHCTQRIMDLRICAGKRSVKTFAGDGPPDRPRASKRQFETRGLVPQPVPCRWAHAIAVGRMMCAKPRPSVILSDVLLTLGQWRRPESVQVVAAPARCLRSNSSRNPGRTSATRSFTLVAAIPINAPLTLSIIVTTSCA